MKGTGKINGGVQYHGWIIPPAPPRAAVRAGGGRGPAGRCPSGQPRGTLPSAESEAQWNMAGAQYDFDAGNRLHVSVLRTGDRPRHHRVEGTSGEDASLRQPPAPCHARDAASIDAICKRNEWNELHIIAIGNQTTNLLNGRVLSILIDHDTPRVHKTGIIGLELEATGKLFARNS